MSLADDDQTLSGDTRVIWMGRKSKGRNVKWLRLLPFTLVTFSHCDLTLTKNFCWRLLSHSTPQILVSALVKIWRHDASLCVMIKSDSPVQSVLYLQARREAIASVPPLESLARSTRVSLSLLLAAREDQSFIEPIKAGKSTAVYKVQV